MNFPDPPQHSRMLPHKQKIPDTSDRLTRTHLKQRADRFVYAVHSHQILLLGDHMEHLALVFGQFDQLGSHIAL